MRGACLLSVLFLFAFVSLAIAQKKTNLDPLLGKHTYEKDGAKLPYRLLSPDGYKKDGKDTYPLVIFLHGAGERGDDNKAQLVHGVGDFAKADNRKSYPCFLIAPQCPKGQIWVRGSIPALEKKLKKDSVDQGELVLGLIEAVRKEYRIDPKRIYLTGLSMGGYGTWALLARKPELFAAGIPICGGGNVKTADKLTKIPIWAFHGDEDKPVPVARSREMIAAIEKAGGKPKYTEYKGVDHDSWTQTYSDADVHKWLFAQKKE